MKRLVITTIVYFFLVFSSACKKKEVSGTPSPPVDQSSFASATEINQRLDRGVNVGDTYESSWAARESDPADFRRMAEIGLKHVRIPIRWELAARSMYASPYTITSSFLTKIKSVVDDALKNKLHVIINMHHHDSCLLYTYDAADE